MTEKRQEGLFGKGKCCVLTVKVVYRMVPFVKMQPIVLSKWMYHIVYKLYLHKVHGEKKKTTKKTTQTLTGLSGFNPGSIAYLL